MNKALLGLLIFASGAAVTLAQSPAIGIVDADQVIQRSAKGKKFFEEYEQVTKTLREDIEKMVNAYNQKQKDLQAKAASMSEEQRSEASKDLNEDQSRIKRAQEDAQAQTTLMLNQKLDEFRKVLAPLIRQVAIEKGLILVLNYGPNSNIVYFSETVDITDEVIRKFDSTGN